MAQPMKTCLRCKAEKNEEDFPKRGDKRRGVCKECTYLAKNEGQDNPGYDKFMAWFETLSL